MSRVYLFCTLYFAVLVSSAVKLVSSQTLLQEFNNYNDIYATSNGVGLWIFPRGCHQNCRTIEWYNDFINGEIVMKFQILASADVDYVAIAISTDTTLGDDAAYVCSRIDDKSSGVNVHSAIVNENSPPVIEEYVTGGSGAVSNSAFNCSFYIPTKVSKFISGKFHTWDLALNPFNLLYVEGKIGPNGKLLHYNFITSTNQAFDMRQNDFYKTLPQVSEDLTQHPQHESLSVPISPKDDIVGFPGPTGGVWYIDGCTDINCRHVRWTQKNGLMYFTISGSSEGWIAIAISQDTEMGDDDCYYCARESVDIKFESAYLVKDKPPVVVDEEKYNDHFLYGNIIENRMSCVFTRPFSVTKNVDGQDITWDLSEKHFNLLYAEGNLMSDGRLIQHTFTSRTHKEFYFLSNDGYKKPKKDDVAFLSKSPVYFAPAFEPQGKVLSSENGGSYWTFPENCNERNCRSMSSKIDQNGLMINFTLTASTEADYIAILITKGTLTSPHHSKILDNDGECYFCWRPDPECPEVIVSKGSCSSTSKSTLTKIENAVGVRETSRMWCSFLMPTESFVTIDNQPENFNLSRDYFYAAYEEGDVIDDVMERAYLTFRSITPKPVLWANFTEFQFETTYPEIEKTTEVVQTSESPTTEEVTDAIVEKIFTYAALDGIAEKRIFESKTTTPKYPKTTTNSAPPMSAYLTLSCSHIIFSCLAAMMFC